MLTQRRLSFALVTAIAVLCGARTAHATSVEFLATPLGQDEPAVHILMDEEDGDITFTLTAEGGITDLRKVFLNVDDPAVLKGLTVLGDDVAGFSVNFFDSHDHHGKKHDWDDKDDWDRWDKKHHDNGKHLGWDKHDKKHHDNGKHLGWDKHDNEHGDEHHSKTNADITIALGVPCDNDDLTETTFVLDAKGPLSIDDFEKIRLTVKGFPKCDDKDKKCDEDKEIVLHLVAKVPNQPVPEPGTAMLLALGLGSLGYARRRQE